MVHKGGSSAVNSIESILEETGVRSLSKTALSRTADVCVGMSYRSKIIVSKFDRGKFLRCLCCPSF